jgi:hypothetical protein
MPIPLNETGLIYYPIATKTVIDELEAHYPDYVACKNFNAVYTQVVKILDAPSRDLLARVCDFLASVVEADVTRDWTALVAPQVVALNRVALGLRSLAALCRRYAQYALLTGTLNLTREAHAIISAFQLKDPANGIPVSNNPTADCLTVCYGAYVT